MSNVDIDGVEEGHSSEEISEVELYSNMDYIDVNFSKSKFVPRQIFRNSVSQPIKDSIDLDFELGSKDKGDQEEEKRESLFGS
jgi:hypothetical protein